MAEGKEVPCAFCGASIVGGDFVLCSKCDIPAHRECWATNGKCPAYACGGTEPLEPAVAIYRRQKRESVGSGSVTTPGFRPSRAAAQPSVIEEDLSPDQIFGSTPVEPNLASRIATLEKQLDAMNRETLRKTLRILAASLPLVILIIATEGDPAMFVMSVLVMVMIVMGVTKGGGAQNARLIRALEERLESLKIQQIEENAGRDPVGSGGSTRNPFQR